MHGGLKFYRGAAAAARNYVEADRSRADDYYLSEGSGLAERLVATVGPTGRAAVVDGGAMDGDAYELWVAGYTTDGITKGRLRKDDQALRFVEVVVNGPKTWSLAASVNPAIARAYDAAQVRAAQEIVGWLAEHSTTRVGPRGLQVQVPVTQIEAAVVRHYTSRAGDPHRHLHLQINARVLEEGTWRGLHTAGTRDQIEAINGIGHAAVQCDPEFRTTLAAQGYTLDPESGEILELKPYAPAFSARAGQITRNVERYEAEWRVDHPEQEPGSRLQQAWDRRAWAQARPDKVIPTDGAQLAAHWREELAEMGFRPPTPIPSATRAIPLYTTPSPAPPQLSGPDFSRLSTDPARDLPRVGRQPGEVYRSIVAEVVLVELGKKHSAWNAADIRGEVERMLAFGNLVADPAARRALVEDITAQAVNLCVPLLRDMTRVPESVRALTSQRNIEVEDDLIKRIDRRSLGNDRRQLVIAGPHITDRLSGDQQVVVAAIAGEAPLVVVEGAAGAGKTFTLKAAFEALREDDRNLVVVAPTQKAAQVAQAEMGARATSAAKLIHAYGYRWDDPGEWRRVEPNLGDLPRCMHLDSSDVVVIDEASMLDQDTAHALMTIADETGAKVVFMGDRHQLNAVGRGGVFDHAINNTDPDCVVSWSSIRRFTDPEYGDLTLHMRTAENPAAVFDRLLARGEIVIHPSEAERTAALTAAGAAGDLVIADSREHVRSLNGHIRDLHTRLRQQSQHSTADPSHPSEPGIMTWSGRELHVGDRVATRKNDRHLDVVNRERWTITEINQRARTVTLAGERGTRTVPTNYAADHVSLAYATTVHGAQGDTVDNAHFALNETSLASATYVAMTRGREHNTAHIVAANPEAARAQWVRTFTRHWADLGVGHARNVALEALERSGPLHARPTYQEMNRQVAHSEALRDLLQPQPTSSSSPSYTHRHSPDRSRGYGPSI